MRLVLQKILYKAYFYKSRRNALLTENFFKTNKIKILKQIVGPMGKITFPDYKASVVANVPQPQARQVISDLEQVDRVRAELEVIQNISIRESNEVLTDNEKKMLFYSTSLRDSRLAEIFLGLRTLDKQGGMLLETTVFPQLNKALFSTVTSAPDIERLKVNMVLHKLYDKGELRTVYNAPDYGDYPGVSKAIFDEVKSIVEQSSANNLLSPLGDISINHDQVMLGDFSGIEINRPVVLGVGLSSDFAGRAASEMSTLHLTIQSSPSGFSSQNDIVDEVDKYFAGKSITLSEQKILAVSAALFNLHYANNNDVFFDSELYGNGALNVSPIIRGSINN